MGLGLGLWLGFGLGSGLGLGLGSGLRPPPSKNVLTNLPTNCLTYLEEAIVVDASEKVDGVAKHGCRHTLARHVPG